MARMISREARTLIEVGELGKRDQVLERAGVTAQVRALAFEEGGDLKSLRYSCRKNAARSPTDSAVVANTSASIFARKVRERNRFTSLKV